MDGISEFTVLKDNYSAKYGFTGGGQVLIVTKSGADTFHGTAWEYLRNNAFDASNYFSTATQGLHQNMFGYTLGGPVIIPQPLNKPSKYARLRAPSSERAKQLRYQSMRRATTHASTQIVASP